MSTLAIATSVLVLFGAALMFIAILRGRKIQSFVPAELQRRWRMMVTLMLFFLAGYICLIIILVKRLPLPTELITGPIFIGGALFVFIVINLTRGTIVRIRSTEEELRLINESLEQRVIKRAGALQLSHEFLRTVLDSLNDEVLIIDTDTYKIQDANKSLLAQYGLTLDEVIGKTCYEVTHNRTEICSPPYDLCPLLETMDTDRLAMSEHIHYDKNGRKIYAEVSTYPIMDPDGSIRQVVHVTRDITERKQANEALRKSEERYKNFIDSTLDGIFHANAEGFFTMMNRSGARIFGYETPEEIIGRNALEYWRNPKDRDVYRAELKIRKSVSAYPMKARKKNGEPIELESSSRIVEGENGKFLGIEGILRDVTERKQAQETLREQKLFAESLIENSAVATFVLNNQHEVVFWNKACYELTGISASNMIGTQDQWKPFYARKRQVLADIIIDGNFEDITALYGSYEQPALLQSGLHSECWFPNLNGRDRYMIFDAAPIYNTKGELTVVIETLQDITELKRTDEELRKIEKKYKDLFDSTLDGIYQMDADSVFILMNPAGAKMFGHERPDEIIGRKGLEYWRDPGDQDVFRTELKTKKSVSGYHMRLKKKNGEPLELETTSTIKEDAKGTFLGIEGILRDVTDRKKLEDQLRHAQKMEAVGTLAGGIAHDFNNILNVIMGYGNMVLDSLEANSPSKGQMNEVLAAAEKAANLTRRLLVFSRKQLADVKPTNVNELITCIQKMLVRIMRENIEFSLELANSCLLVMADAGQIEQVLINLASNARDAMPEGGRLTIRTELQELDDEYVAVHGYGKSGKYAIITVSDTGHGMDAETQKNIFEPFFTTKGIGEGTGLGLAISYGIIKQHNGYIKVFSEPGQSTVFKIYLPIIDESASLDKKMEAPDSIRGGNETILVAEDDDSLRKLTSIVLESLGYSVITAENGEDAVTKFTENWERIDLAIIDMIMPKKNGKEVSEVIRKVSPRIKILFASGYTMDIIKNKELTELGFDFIHKPVSSKDLLKKVREILDK